MNTIINLFAIVGLAIGGPKKPVIDPGVLAYMGKLESCRRGERIDQLGALYAEKFQSTVVEGKGKESTSEMTREEYVLFHKKLIESVEGYQYNHEVLESKRLKGEKVSVKVLSRWSFSLNGKKVSLSATEEFLLQKKDGVYSVIKVRCQY